MARRDPDLVTVVASAAAVRLADEDPGELSPRAKRIGQFMGWQAEAWGWFGRLGEVWYSHTWKGNAIGGLDWLILHRQADGDLVPAMGADGTLVEGADPKFYALAQDALGRLVGAAGSHAEWARPLGTSISCVAEGWLVGYNIDADGDPVPGTLYDAAGQPTGPNEEAVSEVWDAFSPTELTRAEDDQGRVTIMVQRSEVENKKQQLPSDTVAVRIWYRHPRFPDDADGPMRALLDVCEDLWTLRMGVRGSALSRTHAGLLLIPQEGLGQPPAAHANAVSGGGSQGQGPPPNPVVTEIIAGLTTGHRDPGSASIMVPTTITTKSDHIPNWTHLALTRDIDPLTPGQREELIRAYATGVDLPPERLLGMGDVNHWTAWQIGEDSWRHVDPQAQTIAAGITSGYLWPAMLADIEAASELELEATPEQRQACRQFHVGYDPTGVIISPDRSADADEAFDRGAIGWPAYRRYKHFPDTDAPSTAELELRARYGFTAKGAQQPGAQPGPAASTPPGQATVRAAATPDVMARYAQACARLESGFFRDVLLACDAAVDEAVRKARARLRSAAQKDSALRGITRGVPLDQVPAVLGPRAVRTLRAELEATDGGHGLFAGTMALLLLRYSALVSAAQREWRRLTSTMLGVEFDAQDIAEMDADAAASAVVLESGARAAAESALHDAGSLLDATGEVPVGVTIPPVVVRRAAARAGGAPVGGGLAPLPAGIEGGVTSGPTVDQIMGRRSYIIGGLLWDYGSSATRENPYEPHEDLDGVEAPDADGFLGFYPGDHRGCQCTVVRLYESTADLGIGDSAEE